MQVKKMAVVFTCILLVAPLLAGCGPKTESESLPTIRFLADDSEAAKKYAQGLQEIFRKNLGIELVLENVDFATRLQKTRDGDFDLVFPGWAADYNDPLSFLGFCNRRPLQRRGLVKSRVRRTHQPGQVIY